MAALADLVVSLRDSQRTLRTAAERAESSDLRLLLFELSTQRSGFAGEIHNEMERLGDPEDPGSGTVAGSLHRGLLNVRTALLSDRDRIVVEECDREDEAVLARYADALNRDLPRYIRELLERQLEQIGAAHAHLQNVSYKLSHVSDSSTR
jgi:uncharacterized protein (TIGR02284 family)